MIRPSLVLHGVVAALALGACTSDGDKRDGGGDAGVSVRDGAQDAGAGTAASDAGADLALVDSGTMADAADAKDADAGQKPPPVIEGGRGPGATPVGEPVGRPDTPQLKVWNRVLVKARAKDLSPTDLQELVERSTGAKVAKVRRTAGTFWLIELAPVTPARGKDDQQKVIETLKGTGAFAVVEGDQLMQLK